MDERDASMIAERWPGGDGLVPRGPRWLLGWAPASAEDVERHTGERPAAEIWRVQVGGRFLRAGGLVYPGGVPFPQDLQSRTAVVSSEVWLYVDAGTLHVEGLHWWPEAVRRPIASAPTRDFDDAVITPPLDADVPFALGVPRYPGWEATLVAVKPSGEVVVLLCADGGLVPEPLNEMLVYEEGGLSLRARAVRTRPTVRDVLRRHQPPFRAVEVSGEQGAGRDPGRALGPQTWPWPAELMWWTDGVSYELKGFRALGELVRVASTLEAVD